MTREKSYTPVASYDQLKLAETAVAQATTDHIRCCCLAHSKVEPQCEVGGSHLADFVTFFTAMCSRH